MLLDLVLASYQQQTIKVILNGHPLGKVKHCAFSPATYTSCPSLAPQYRP